MRVDNHRRMTLRRDRTKRAWRYGPICYVQIAALGSSLALALQTSPANATNDAAPTRTFVAAQYQLTRSVDLNLTSGLTSMDAFVKHVQRECPNVGSEAPPSALVQAQKVVREMGGALLVVLLHNDRHAILRFTRVVAPLHWSASRLTNIVKSEALKLEQFRSIAIPDLCADVRAWATRHFEVLPTRTVQLDQQLTASESSLHRSDLRVVQGYENSKIRALARRAQALQKRFERREGKHALRAFFALVRTIFGQCTPGKLCLPFQVLTPGDLERGQISDSNTVAMQR